MASEDQLWAGICKTIVVGAEVGIGARMGMCYQTLLGLITVSFQGTVSFICTGFYEENMNMGVSTRMSFSSRGLGAVR